MNKKRISLPVESSRDAVAEAQASHPVFSATSRRLNLLLLILGILLPVVAFEGVYRMILARHDSAAWRDRPSLFYVPESSTDNRDFYYPPEKPEGTFRIVVIGDSFTYAGKGQFDDSFSKRLERMLNLNEQQRKVEVLNWGVPGYSTWQEADFVRRAASRYHADLVLLQMTLNDPEIVPYHATGAYKERQKTLEFLGTSPLFQHWQSLRFLVERYYNWRSEKEYFSYYFDLFNSERTWRRFYGAIGNIQKISESNNVPVFPVIFPLFSHPLTDAYPFSALHEKIHGAFDDYRIRYLDLLSSYHNIPPERLQAVPGADSHPNEIAHRIAADTIYSALVSNNLIPEDVRIKELHPHRKLRNPIPRRKELGQPEEKSANESANEDEIDDD